MPAYTVELEIGPHRVTRFVDVEAGGSGDAMARAVDVLIGQGVTDDIHIKAATRRGDPLRAERAELAAWANSETSNGRGGWPVLTASSTRETVCAWLQRNDRNGSHTDERARAEGIDPLTETEAWAALAAVLNGDD